MSKYTYEDYIKNGCHPTGYNKACESYYFGQSTVDTLLDKIADLEAKLEDKEEAIKYLKGIKRYDIGEMLTENAKLKQQLAESEEKCNKQWLEIQAETHQIQMLEQDIKRIKKENKQQFAEKDKEHKKAMRTSLNDFLTLEVEFKKKKISFAVEQIIKTKETLIKFLQDEGFYENEWYDLFDKIDNQIKQLKEGK